MAVPLPVHVLSPAEYLLLERAAEYKSEYLDGEMFAMAGATFAHNVISANTLRELGNALKGKPARRAAATSASTRRAPAFTPTPMSQ